MTENPEKDNMASKLEKHPSFLTGDTSTHEFWLEFSSQSFVRFPGCSPFTPCWIIFLPHFQDVFFFLEARL